MASPSEEDGSETNELELDTSEYSPLSEAASAQDGEQLQSLVSLKLIQILSETVSCLLMGVL
jgi:hypothetical protein